MEEETIKLIYKFNEHWQTGEISKDYRETIRREQYKIIYDYLDEKQIIAITGLRRVGKTVIMHQIIDSLLKKGTMAKDIFYFSFDEAIIREHIIEDIIQFYENNIVKEELQKAKRRVYIFLDEIQYVENWQAVLKRYYDLNYKIKFIISGSSSIPITKKAKESLAGRIYDFVINPLTFDEYLIFKGLTNQIKCTKRPLANFAKIEKEYIEHLKIKDKLTALFNEYAIKGGFPENVQQEDLNKVQAYITNSVIDKIIYKDIPKTFKIRNPDLLLKILQIFSNYSSDLFSIDNISEMLNVNRNMIAKYLFYLERAFLLHISYNYTKSLVKQLRTMKKGYVADSGIINAMLKRGEEIISYPESYGKIVETIVFNYLRTKHKINFFRDKQKREVDIIVIEREVLPIEVKYQNQITNSDTKNILFFMQEKKLEKGIVITKDLFKVKTIENKKILFIPAWLFLLLF